MSYKALLKTSVDLQALGLAADNYGFVKKKKKKLKDYFGQGIKNTAGAAMIDAEADFLL